MGQTEKDNGGPCPRTGQGTRKRGVHEHGSASRPHSPAPVDPASARRAAPPAQTPASAGHRRPTGRGLGRRRGRANGGIGAGRCRREPGPQGRRTRPGPDRLPDTHLLGHPPPPERPYPVPRLRHRPTPAPSLGPLPGHPTRRGPRGRGSVPERREHGPPPVHGRVTERGELRPSSVHGHITERRELRPTPGHGRLTELREPRPGRPRRHPAPSRRHAAPPRRPHLDTASPGCPRRDRRGDDVPPPPDPRDGPHQRRFQQPGFSRHGLRPRHAVPLRARLLRHVFASRQCPGRRFPRHRSRARHASRRTDARFPRRTPTSGLRFRARFPRHPTPPRRRPLRVPSAFRLRASAAHASARSGAAGRWRVRGVGLRWRLGRFVVLGRRP